MNTPPNVFTKEEDGASVASSLEHSPRLDCVLRSIFDGTGYESRKLPFACPSSSLLYSFVDGYTNMTLFIASHQTKSRQEARRARPKANFDV
jgi:hypothetical protein